VRIIGFCQKCRRIKNVRVSSGGMVALAQGHVAVGVCADCEK